MEVITRFNAPKNNFWRKARIIGAAIAGIGTIIVTAPVSIPLAGIGAYLVTIGTTIAGVAQLTTE